MESFLDKNDHIWFPMETKYDHFCPKWSQNEHSHAIRR